MDQIFKISIIMTIIFTATTTIVLGGNMDIDGVIPYGKSDEYGLLDGLPPSFWYIVEFLIIDPDPKDGTWLLIEGIEIYNGEKVVRDSDCIYWGSYIWQVDLKYEGGKWIL